MHQKNYPDLFDNSTLNIHRYSGCKISFILVVALLLGERMVQSQYLPHVVRCPIFDFLADLKVLERPMKKNERQKLCEV
jgi:hypothetical protein